MIKNESTKEVITKSKEVEWRNSKYLKKYISSNLSIQS